LIIYQATTISSAISHVAVKSSHKGSKGTKSSTKSTLYLRETSSLGVFLPAVQDFGRRVWQEKGQMRNCCYFIILHTNQQIFSNLNKIPLKTSTVCNFCFTNT
jgi:hypothetical protein